MNLGITKQFYLLGNGESQRQEKNDHKKSYNSKCSGYDVDLGLYVNISLASKMFINLYEIVMVRSRGEV